MPARGSALDDGFMAMRPEGTTKFWRVQRSGLDWIGVRLDENLNSANEPVIFFHKSPVTVGVICTDEESIIARMAVWVLGLG
jgi:acetate kinase